MFPDIESIVSFATLGFALVCGGMVGLATAQCVLIIGRKTIWRAIKRRVLGWFYKELKIDMDARSWRDMQKED